MPLEHAPVGSAGFGNNIREMIEHGHPQKQAVAAAYRAARGDELDPLTDRAVTLSQRADGVTRRADEAVRQDAVRVARREGDA